MCTEISAIQLPCKVRMTITICTICAYVYVSLRDVYFLSIVQFEISHAVV